MAAPLWSGPFSNSSMRRAVSCPDYRCLHNGDGNTLVHFRCVRAVVKCTKSATKSTIPPANEADAMRHLDFESMLAQSSDTLLAPHHECVARVLDCVVHPSSEGLHTYLTTRYYPLPDLYTFCAHFPTGVPWRVALGVARNLARALAVCHRHGVAHGDVKPENVLVNAADLSVTLIDFAFARRGVIHMAKNKYMVKAVAKAGTPPYLAPELLYADEFAVVNAVLLDVYALGITLAFITSFNRGSPCDDYSCIAQGMPRAVKQELLSQGWPRSFFDAAKRCCAHWPPDRPSAVELLGLLAHC